MTNQVIDNVFTCGSCNKQFKLKNPQRKIICSCGNQVITKAPEVDSSPVPCLNRGEKIRGLDCKCAGKPMVYECNIFGECILNKVYHTKAKGFAVCRNCEKRVTYNANRLGIAYVNMQRVGGAETFVSNLSEAFHDIFSGVATLSHSGVTSEKYRVFSGRQSLFDLAAKSEVVLVWGFTDHLQELANTFPSTKFIAIHHGSLDSTWANEIFEKQLKITKLGVAVNHEVAKFYNVTYLPNPTKDHGIRKSDSKCDKIRVLWNHRWSGEKRPELMMKTALQLVDEAVFYVSGSKHQELPSNCVNVYQNASNVNLLSESDVFLSTASQEAFGYSIAEAAYAKVPVVCGPYGIGRHIATRLVESENPSEWAEAIRQAAGKDCEPKAKWVAENHGSTAIESWDKFINLTQLREEPA